MKSPKLYFYDTGLACALLKIRSEEQLNTHYIKGNLFESLIISDLIKQQLNRGLSPNLYFWRDRSGYEIDCILDEGSNLKPIEINSGRTINRSFFAGLIYWNKLAKSDPGKSYLIYGGKEKQKRSICQVLGWTMINEIQQKVP